jgi:glutamate-1-semialdehyde 2,1-aminomutase
VSYSHTDNDIDLTVAAIDEALAVYRRALDDGVERHLVGRPSQTVYRCYNRPQESSPVWDPHICSDGASGTSASVRSEVSA